MRIRARESGEGKPLPLRDVLTRGNKISLDAIDEMQDEIQVSSDTSGSSVVENSSSQAVEGQNTSGQLLLEEIRVAFQKNKPFKIKIKGSSGEMEDGWIATGGNKRGEVVVMTEGAVDGRILSKTIPLEELLETNGAVFTHSESGTPTTPEEKDESAQETPSSTEESGADIVESVPEDTTPTSTPSAEDPSRAGEQEKSPKEKTVGERWNEVRAEYKAYKNEVEAAQQEYLRATEAYENKRQNAGFMGRFMKSSAFDEEKRRMLEAEKKYDELLDGLRNRRQERLEAKRHLFAKGGEEAKEVVARHEALLERFVDHEVQMVEGLRYNESEQGESRNKYLRGIKSAWNWYRKLPLAKRLAVSAAVGGVVGAFAGATGLVAGGAAVVGATVAARRAVGGLFGSVVALETKRLGDSVIESYERKKLEEQQRSFKEKELSRSRRERLGIKKTTRWQKRGATVVAASAAVAAGAGTSSAFNSLVDMTGGDVPPSSETPIDEVSKEGVTGEGAIQEESASAPKMQENVGKGEDTSIRGETDTKKTVFDRSRGRADLLREKALLGRTIAQKMGITDLDNLKIESEGHVPTMINGKEVPMELLSPEQQEAVSVARKVHSWMAQGGEPSTGVSVEGISGLDVESDVDVTEGKSNAVVEAETKEESVPVKKTAFEVKNEQAMAKVAHFEEKAEVNSRIAQEMGIEDTKNLKVTYGPSGRVETINGIRVPDSIHQEKPSIYSIALDEDQVRRSDYVTKDLQASEQTIDSGPKVSSSNIPEYVPGSAIDDAMAEPDIMELYEKLGITGPKELKMEGVYEAGSSVERELQQFLGNNDWVKEHYPNLTDTERGQIAHRVRLQLEQHPDMAEKLKIQKGDWNKVLANHKYSFYIDRDIVEQEINDIHVKGAGKVVPIPSAKIIPDEVPDEKPVTDTVPVEPTPKIEVEETPPSRDASVSSKSVAEEVLEEMRKEDHPTIEYGEAESGPTIQIESEKVTPTIEEPPIQITEHPAPDVEVEEAPVPVEKIVPEVEKPPVQDVESPKEKISVPEERITVEEPPLQKTPEIVSEEVPQQQVTVEEVEEPKTLEEDLQETKDVFRERGLDYRGIKTSPYLVEFFSDGTFNEMLRGQRHLVLSNWGPISHARLEDILDGRGSLTFTIGDNPPVTMGAEAEQLCRSVLAQLERGLANKVPNIHEIVEMGRQQNMTLGELVKQLSEKVQEQKITVEEVPSPKTEIPTGVPEAPEVPEALPIEEYMKPNLIRQTTSIGIEGAQASYRAELPYTEVSPDIKDYVQKQYLAGHSEWNAGSAKDLYNANFDFKRAVDLELADIALVLRGDENIPLSGIIVDWSKFDGLTPREVLEQLEQHEDLLEKMSQTEKITDSNVSINVEQQ